MEQIQDSMGMLDLMIRPAFCVRNGAVIRVNGAAQARYLEVGTPIVPLLITGQQEYAEFTDGCLHLMLTVAGESVNASVIRMEDCDVFLLEEDADRAELRAMALAAQELRVPLASVMTMMDRLLPTLNLSDAPNAQEQTARINRGLFQMLRLVSNVSDADRYCSAAAHMETREVNALVEEIFTSTGDLHASTGIEVRYSGLRDPLYCLVDWEKLERAIFNILSNAMKFTARGGIIEGSLTRKGNWLYLSVWDNGSGIAPELRGSVFSRFRREPAIEDGRYGIGLGMVLIRSAAAAHGGTVLVEQPKDGGTRITMTIEIRKSTTNTLRTPILRVDYAGERDHRLIELSESLPASLYERNKIN